MKWIKKKLNIYSSPKQFYRGTLIFEMEERNIYVYVVNRDFNFRFYCWLKYYTIQ